jgi:UDP-N-acetylglucosamine 2-epimerase (non-hydrolysing)
MSVLSGTERICLLEPLDYLTFLQLMARAHLILTDSGGIQEEAPTLRKPLLVLRKLTERPEAFQAGLAKIVGTSREAIVAEASRLLTDPEAYRWARGESPLLAPEEAFRAAPLLAVA